MSKRYMPRSSFSLGRGYVFVNGHKQKDGTHGYTEHEVGRLTKQQIRDHFDVIDVSGKSVVEQATAAPGEERAVSRICDECGFEAATVAGLGAHRRTHS